MKVLLLIEEGAPCRFWENSIPLLLSSGIEIVFVSLRERGPIHEIVEKMGRPALSLDCQTSHQYPAAVLRLRKIINYYRVDVVHACESIPAAVSGLAGLTSKRNKRIFHRQHTLSSGKQRILSLLGSHLTHQVMGCSHSAAKSAHDRDRVPSSRIRVAYNGISPMRKVSKAEVMNLRQKLGISPDAKVISLVARLRKEKGHRTLMAATEIMKPFLAEKPHLLFVGSGPEEVSLKKEARTLSSAVIHFVGHQPDVALWFSAADVVAMPSFTEPFGLTAIEAMSCGKPLVASNVEGLSEIVEDGTSGLLVPPRCPNDLAQGLLKVLLSSDLKSHLSKGARARANFFSLQNMVANWIVCYNSVLKPPKSSFRRFKSTFTNNRVHQNLEL
jgi:glycosyltransferase involved in cell wall biosynthesis